MKRIAVVAGAKEYAEYLRNNLALFLDKYADLRCYSLEEAEELPYFEEEYVAVSAFTLFQNVKDKVGKSSEMIILSLVLTKENVKPLAALPKGTRALLVNLDYRTCMQVITNLYSVGFRDMELVPYYGVGDYDRSIQLAITPDEGQNLPPDMGRVINIGQRSIDLSCIIDIADKLGVEGVLRSSEAFELRKNMYFGNDSMEKILGENQNLAGRVDGLIKVMKQGILITDLVGSVLLCNEKAEELLKSEGQALAGFNITDVLSGVDLTEPQNGKEQLIRVGGQMLVAVVTELATEQERNGAIVTIDNFEEMEDKQHGIRTRLSQVSHVARYHFADIIGNSRALMDVVVTARRMAKSDSSVLITGESGTGKEIFAQSIHNESGRKKYNFVAVNCAAIPENLLESEMFGYEEGSFTGAKKGGKIGYFELAHRGTIFLDEIAELPLLLQSKLLRVIEERKIIKIGSQKEVDVDVRIIAATNSDLYAMAEDGKFREDLYYRLGVLPLHIPPLRERPEDVEVLLSHFMSKYDVTMNFTVEAKAALRNYPWKGNVRELRNAVEYMASLEKTEIDLPDLPFLVRRWVGRGAETGKETWGKTDENKGDDPGKKVGKQAGMEPGKEQGKEVGDEPGTEAGTELGLGGSEIQEDKAGNGIWGGETTQDGHGEDLMNDFLLREGRNVSLYGFVLRELKACLHKGQRMGRAGLKQIAEQKDLFYSEPEIRSALRKLDEWGYVQSARGRGGSRITQKGLELCRRIEGLIG